LPFTYYYEYYYGILGRIMLGYTVEDLNNMKYSVDTAILLINSDENPAIYNYLLTTSDFLGGLWAEGYFD